MFLFFIFASVGFFLWLFDFAKIIEKKLIRNPEKPL